jgi:hypothetical protein
MDDAARSDRDELEERLRLVAEADVDKDLTGRDHFWLVGVAGIAVPALLTIIGLLTS